MELTNDPKRAEVVVFYLLNIRRALIIDRRQHEAAGPFVDVVPHDELLLQGRPVQEPLTPEIVRAIEGRQTVPRQPRLMQTYLRHLVQVIGSKLSVLRPGLGEPRSVSLGPHLAPVLMLASSEVWQGLLREMEASGDAEAAARARGKMRELHAWEIAHRERRYEDQVEMLRADFNAHAVFKPYGH